MQANNEWLLVMLVIVYVGAFLISFYFSMIKESRAAYLFLWSWAILLCLGIAISSSNYSLVLYSLIILGCVIYLYLSNNNLQEKLASTPKQKSTHSANVLRSLHRIMNDNKRVMALHNNWVYGKREHPYIMFKNLDGSHLRLRASLSDMKTIFPEACYISRNEIINLSVGVHEFKETKVVLHIKTGEITVNISPALSKISNSTEKHAEALN